MLQPVISNGRSRLHCSFNVSGLNELPLSLRAVRPGSSEAVCLQLHSDLQTIRIGLPHCTLFLLHLWQQSELVLKVVADLVSNHVGLRELAGLASDVASAEAPFKVLKETCVEVNLLVIRTIKWTHCGLGKPTARLCRS